MNEFFIGHGYVVLDGVRLLPLLHGNFETSLLWLPKLSLALFKSGEFPLAPLLLDMFKSTKCSSLLNSA